MLGVIGASIVAPFKRNVAPAAMGGLIGNRFDASVMYILNKLSSNDVDTSIRGEFVDLASRFRLDNNELLYLERRLRSPLSALEAASVRALMALNSGDRLNDEDFVLLSQATESHRQGNAAVLIRTLLGSHLVRRGHAHQASLLISSISMSQLEKYYKIDVIEQTLSANYVSLPRSHTLYPREWGFDSALMAFQDFSSDYEIKIINAPTILIEIPEKFHNQTIQAFAERSVRGFYLLIFTLLYWSASQRSGEYGRVADVFWNTLKDFILKFEKKILIVRYGIRHS